MRILISPSVTLAIVCLLSSLVAVNAEADVIFNVDFQSNLANAAANQSSGAVGVIGAAGHVWNNITATNPWIGFESATGNLIGGGGPFVARNVVDSSGLSTFGLTMTLSNSVSTSPTTGGNRANTGTLPNQFVATDAESLMRDYLFLNNATATMTLTLEGLQSGYNYRLYLYGAGNNTNQGATFSVQGVGGTQSTAAEIANALLTLGQDYVVFDFDDSLTSRQVTIANNGLTSFTPFNGFQLQATAIPEPSSFALMGLASVAAAGYRRRQRNKSKVSA